MNKGDSTTVCTELAAGQSLRCLIVDDETAGRDELRFMLERIDGVQVVGAAADAEEARMLINAIGYDIVFLDIHMPGVDGIEFARTIQGQADAPAVVFVTAHPDHALEAFETAAVDYLLKPVDERRLGEAIRKASTGRGSTAILHRRDDNEQSTNRSEPRKTKIPVQQAGRTVFVDEEDIVLASASRGYSHLQLRSERVLVNYSLAELESRLSGSFARVHRSHLVNLDCVRELKPDFSGGVLLVLSNDEASEVKVARRQASAIRHRLGL